MGFWASTSFQSKCAELTSKPPLSTTLRRKAKIESVERLANQNVTEQYVDEQNIPHNQICKTTEKTSVSHASQVVSEFYDDKGNLIWEVLQMGNTYFMHPSTAIELAGPRIAQDWHYFNKKNKIFNYRFALFDKVLFLHSLTFRRMKRQQKIHSFKS